MRHLLVTLSILLIAATIYSQDNAGPTHRLAFTLAGGWGKYSMGDLNDDYVNNYGEGADPFTEPLSNGPQWIAQLSFDASRKFALVGGLTRAICNADDQTISGTDRYLHTSMWYPNIGIMWKVNPAPPLIRLGGGIGVCFGSLERKSVMLMEPDDGIREYTANAIAYHLAGELEIPVTSSFGLSLLTGMRFAKTATISGDGVVMYDYLTANDFTLDFSGPYAMLGLTFRP